MQDQAPQEGQGLGEATKIAQQVGAGLQKLSEMLNQSQAATDADKEKMAMVLNGFVELVESNLAGQAPGQDAEAEPEPMPAAVPMEGGLKGKPAGPQMR